MPVFTWHFVQNISRWYQQVLFNISSGEVSWEFVSYLIPQLLFMACIAITYFFIFKIFIMQFIANIRYIKYKKAMAAGAMLLPGVPNGDPQQKADSLSLYIKDSTLSHRDVEG